MGKMEHFDQDSHLTLLELFVHLWDIPWQSCWSVMEFLVQARGGKEAPILSSLLFLVCNRSGTSQSLETQPQSCAQHSSMVEHKLGERDLSSWGSR